MDTAVSAAQAYLARGYAPVDIPRGRKGPVRPDWQHLRLGEADLVHVFHNGSNIGLLLGEPSGDLVDVDLDCDEARLIAGWLPETHMRHGRSGKPPTHAWYRARPCPARTRKFEDTDGATLVELRSTGGQTVVPPSVYPPDPLTGEVDAAVWTEFGAPADVAGDDLAQRVAYVAAGALLIRHWPARGTRDEVALALAGTLVRHGWQEQDAAAFIAAVATLAGDEETAARAKKPEASARRLAAGRTVYGLPTLARLLGSGVVDRLADWLGLREPAASHEALPLPASAGVAGTTATTSAELAVVPPLPPAAWVPDDVLDAIAAVRGAWLDPYIAAARAISPRTPRALLEASGLFGLSCALARRVYVQAGGVALYPSLFLLFVGRSTLTGKTTALKVLRRLFREAGLLSLLLPDRFTEQALAVELSLHVPRHVADGGEKLQVQWAERHRHAAQRGIIRDEMHGLLDDCNRDYNAGLLPLLLSMDGAPDDLPTELTLSRGWVEVRHVCVNLLGATTPAGIRVHAAKVYHWANGLFGRFALIGPDEPPRYAFWTKAEVGIPEPVLWGIKQVYSSFPVPTVQFEYAESGAEGEPTKLKPVAAVQAGYCPQRCLIADDAWDAWQRYNEALWTIAKERGSERLEPTYGRLDGLALRVALILAAGEWALLPVSERWETPVIRVAHWYAAQQVTERWRSGAHAILATALDEEEAAAVEGDTQRLVRALRAAGGRMRRGDVLRRLNWPTAYLDDVLTLAGDAVRQEQVTAGGRPATWLILTEQPA
jgi:hypothetical protein